MKTIKKKKCCVARFFEKRKAKKRKIIKSLLNNKTEKDCPICKENLLSSLLHNVEVDYCNKCLGIWFDTDELRLVKDNKDKELKWLDIDLWSDASKFKINYGVRRLCPSCRMPLYEIYYGDSGVIVDVCSVCHGVWLDRAEFKKIAKWLKDKEGHEVIANYGKNVVRQMAEIFSGPEGLKSEITDLIAILKLFSAKFSAEHPTFSKLMTELPR